MQNQKMATKGLLFFIVTGCYWFSLYTYVPILSTYSLSIGASYSMVGLIVGSYGLAQILIRVPFGILSDRTGSRKSIIMIGILCSLIAAILFFVWPDPYGALTARFVSGVSASAWVVFPVFYVSMFRTQDAAKSMGYLSAVMKIGQVTAIYAGGILAFYGGAGLTFLVGAAAAVGAIFLASCLTEERKLKREPISLWDLLAVAKSKNLLKHSILAIFMQFMTFATVYGFTPVVAQNLGATDQQLGLLTALSTFPGIPAAALSGAFFARRFSAKRTVTFGFLLYSVTLCVIPLTGRLLFLFISQFVGGFASGFIFPLLMSGSMDGIDERKRGSAMGFFQAIYGIGMLLGPYVVGIFSDAGLMKEGFFVTAAVGILAVWVNMWKIRVTNEKIESVQKAQ